MSQPNEIDQIKQLLIACSEEQRYEIFRYLRDEFPIHWIEKELNTDAEVILEAIARASDLTLRGIRGVIAEAAFDTNVVKELRNWKNLGLVGDHAYDFLLEDNVGQIRIQVKMQRQIAHRPMMANEAYRSLPSGKYVVETQRTRGGKRDGVDTRPYKFGEFDILAVSMHPATNNWNDFMFTVGNWLLPRPENANLLLKFQPVAKVPDDDWSDDFQVAADWFRAGKVKRISS